MATNPLLVGYSFMLMASGFVFGWMALPLTYAASCTGGVCWFACTRTIVNRYQLSFVSVLDRYPQQKRWLAALETAVAQRPFRTTLLAQLSFAPFGILCCGLAATPMAMTPFVLATLCSRFKVALYVWLSTQMKTVLEISQHGTSVATTQDIVLLAVNITFSILAIVVVGVYSRRALYCFECGSIVPAEERSQFELLPTNEDATDLAADDLAVIPEGSAAAGDNTDRDANGVSLPAGAI